MKTALQRKQELNAEITMLNTLLESIENKIFIYSAIDMVRVEELSVTKRELELLFLDLLSESNDMFLASQRKVA